MRKIFIQDLRRLFESKNYLISFLFPILKFSKSYRKKPFGQSPWHWRNNAKSAYIWEHYSQFMSFFHQGPWRHYLFMNKIHQPPMFLFFCWCCFRNLILYWIPKLYHTDRGQEDVDFNKIDNYHSSWCFAFWEFDDWTCYWGCWVIEVNFEGFWRIFGIR